MRPQSLMLDRLAQLAHLAMITMSVALSCPAALAQEASTTEAPTAEAPIDIDKVEHEEVRLVLIDVVVVDGEDRTVPGLGRDDFEVLTGGDGAASPSAPWQR